MVLILMIFKHLYTWGAWLTQYGMNAVLDLGVMSSSPTLGVEIALKKKILLKKNLYSKIRVCVCVCVGVCRCVLFVLRIFIHT